MAVALAPDQAIFDDISLVRIGTRFMDDRQECIRWCRQYGLLATQMVCPTCRRHCREQALDRAVNGITWRCPVKACKKRLASGAVAFLRNRICSYGNYLASPICGTGVLESQGECQWKTPSMNCKSGACIP